ncbi:hypothetical protein CNMCM8812_008667 [Aspergillus fumigatus]|nr:hypothetical protein CNMCM8812_008667 [Aspergillus fumigatus]KAF4292534.1 hypothetical protein CNMCM8686_007387 [Aspergillus fumigatus]KAH1300959.1 hypothetical protein KXX11_004669 [Aspergillus fumigatus]KAH1340166.1 hypothetical protein KXX67_008376 [Aspergillus fumigatus]KAH1447737.1 hypothetical protein KXX13_004978 [Aspergillus fumigatus]
MPQNASVIITQATAVITGSFLSGLMMGLSVVDIPVVLDTATQASQLLQHFTRLYDIGHKMMPSLAVTTCLLYGYTASRTTGGSGLPHIIAAVTTISMVPFTWLVMAPTNNALFRMHANPAAANLGEVRRLLVRWAQLHAVRSLFPLMGSVLGLRQILRE